MLEALGRTIHRHAVLTLVLSGAFLAGAVALLLRGGDLGTGVVHGLEAEEAQRLADEVTGQSQDTLLVVIFEDRGPAGDAAGFRASVGRALRPLRGDPRVASVTTAEEAPGPVAARMTSADGRATLAYVGLRGDLKQALAAYPGVREGLRPEGRLAVAVTGKIPFLHDLDRTLESDLLRAELIALPLALLVLLLVFRTAVAAVLPVGVGSLAVAGGLAVVLALSRRMEVASYAINICTLIGLGVAIDYSLFLVSRYREELAAGRDPRDALVRAVDRAGRVILFSGAAVAAGLGGLLFFEGSYLQTMGLAGALVVVLAVAFALTFMPALLAVLGRRIDSGRVPVPRLGRAAGVWTRFTELAARRPLLVFLPALGLVLAMGLPALHLRLAAADVNVLSTDVPARAGYERLRARFPELAANRIVVVARFPTAPALTAERIGALYDLSRDIGRLPGVRKVESIVDADVPLPRAAYQSLLLDPPAMFAGLIEVGKKLTVGERTVVLYALTDAAVSSGPARDVVTSIRARRAVADGTLAVGGETANDLDVTDYILARVPRAVVFVVGVSLVMLFLLLGSVVVPLQAVALSFLSVAASLGALVWVFQDGNLFVPEPRPLEPALPVLLFCSLFGLSMDYEVLMLARMREAWLASCDNRSAVLEGWRRTSTLVASAAGIMVAVFGAFALADVVLLQAVGFGMATAVAADAIFVRLLLVPSAMFLFGRTNWWAPRPLRAAGCAGAWVVGAGGSGRVRAPADLVAYGVGEGTPAGDGVSQRRAELEPGAGR
ncbi:MAG: MMPL family transporter [Deltaproteobacteria bacterium]|nr:MMPL family transporter [Deltaproteobacteria bacterium]